MNIRYLFLVCWLLVVGTVNAAELKGGYPACISEESFHQYVTAMIDEDRRGMQYLRARGYCTITRAGVQVTVLDSTWTGVSKVRAYAPGTAIIIWTNSENIQR